MSSKGLLFVVSAPSGTGKTTVAEQLVKIVPTLELSRSYTSRAPRANERDGVRSESTRLNSSHVSESRMPSSA